MNNLTEQIPEHVALGSEKSATISGIALTQHDIIRRKRKGRFAICHY